MDGEPINEPIDAASSNRGTRINIGSIGPHSGGTAPASAGGAPQSNAGFGTTVRDETPSGIEAPKRRAKRGSTDLASAKGAADMVVGVVQTLAYTRYGSDGRMLPIEEKMAKDGLSQSFARLPAETTRQISNLSAPVMAAFGLLMYGVRLSTLETRRKANAAETQRAEKAAAVYAAHEAANGRVHMEQDPQAQPFNPDSPFQIPNLDDLRGMQEV